MKPSKMQNVQRWTPVVVWMACIFLFSAQPAGTSGALSGSITAYLFQMISGTFIAQYLTLDMLHVVLRKAAHVAVYFVLACLCFRALTLYAWKPSKTLWVTVGLCVLYAITDEYHQTFVPGRSGQVTDVAIDSVGAWMGACCMGLWHKLHHRASKI